MNIFFILADHRAAGIYRSRSAAERRLRELAALPIRWHEEPRLLAASEVPAGTPRREYLAARIERGRFGAID